MYCGCASVYRNAVTPVSLEVIVDRRNAVVDLSTAVSALFTVHKPDGTEHTWIAAIAEKTVDSVTLQYTFAVGDLPLLGKYALFPKIALPGSGYPAVSVEFEVTEYWSA